MASQAPGPGYVWISDGTSGSDPSAAGGGYWAPNPYASVTNQPAPAPNPVAGPNAAIAANWQASQPTQNQLAELLTNPVSGHSPVADYGAQLGRFQFSRTAPVPRTAPVGWGRYPGVDGSPPPPTWLKSGTTPPVTVTPPPNTVGNTNPSYPPGATPGYPPGYGPGTQPPSQTGWMPGPATSKVAPSTMSGFQFQNAAPGSVQETFNKLMSARGPQDAISFLMLYGQQRPEGRGTQSPLDQYIASLRAGGMSLEDTNRIINQFSAGGSGGIFNNDLRGFDATFGMNLPGLLQSIGATMPTTTYTSRYGGLGGRRMGT